MKDVNQLTHIFFCEASDNSVDSDIIAEIQSKIIMGPRQKKRL